MGWRDKIVPAKEAGSAERPRGWRDKIVQPEEPGAIERIQAAAEDVPLWERALQSGAGYGPLGMAVGPARVLADTVTQGADSPLAREAAGMARGAAEGVGSYWRDMVADFTSGDLGRQLGRGADLAQKTLLPSGVPLVEAIVKPETGANAARMAKEIGVGMASTIAKGRLDDDRPLASAGDLAGLGGALSRLPASEPGWKPQPTRKPPQAAQTLRDKAEMMDAQGDYRAALVEEANLAEAKAAADARGLSARKASPLTEKVGRASKAKRLAKTEVKRAEAEYLRAKRTGAPDLDEKAAALKHAKEVQKEAKALHASLKGERLAETPEMSQAGHEKWSLKERKLIEVEPKKRAAAARIRTIEERLPETLLGRVVNKLAQSETSIPTSLKETPGAVLGNPETLRAMASAVERAARGSNYASAALGGGLSAGAGGMSAEQFLSRHRELMRTDPKYREAMQRAGALNVAEFAAR